MPGSILNDGTYVQGNSGGPSWFKGLTQNPLAQAAGVGLAGDFLGSILGAFSDPYKKEFKWWKKKKNERINDINTYIKPKSEYVDIAGNLAAMNANMNNQVTRGLNMYRGGTSGTNPNPVSNIKYPWMT